MNLEEIQSKINKIQEELKTALPEQHDSLVNELFELAFNLEQYLLKSEEEINLEDDE